MITGWTDFPTMEKIEEQYKDLLTMLDNHEIPQTYDGVVNSVLISSMLRELVIHRQGFALVS